MPSSARAGRALLCVSCGEHRDSRGSNLGISRVEFREFELRVYCGAEGAHARGRGNPRCQAPAAPEQRPLEPFGVQHAFGRRQQCPGDGHPELSLDGAGHGRFYRNPLVPYEENSSHIFGYLVDGTGKSCIMEGGTISDAYIRRKVTWRPCHFTRIRANEFFSRFIFV